MLDQINYTYAVIIILVLLLVIWWWRSSASAERFAGASQMVDEYDWGFMSRGLNASNTNGYAPVVRTLSSMEKSKSYDIRDTEFGQFC